MSDTHYAMQCVPDAVLDADDRNGTQFVASGGIERLVSLLPARRPKRANQVIVENAILLLTGLLEINGSWHAVIITLA